MAEIECCHIAAAFDTNDVEAIISVSSRSSTESTKTGDTILKGPTTGTVSITGYAADEVYTGCGARAGVTIPWIRKYDCETDTVHFIFSGEGKSYIAGDLNMPTAGLMAELSNGLDVSYPLIDASATSGPYGIYFQNNQTDGYGLKYYGKPFDFDTSIEGDTNIDLGFGGYSLLYLQSFSIQLVPGQVPTASYEFVFTISADVGACTPKAHS
jgi:hypothetical protein